MVEKNGEKGFVIKDRRRFDEEGKTREDAAREAESAKPDRQSGRSAEEKTQRDEKEEKTESGKEEYHHLPEMNFHNFVLSLYTSVIFSLGEVPDPVSGEKKKDLQAAKQTIDLLGMLEEKTEGNLDTSEKELLEGVLSEARMRYVKELEQA